MSLKRINHGNENHTPGFVENTGDEMTGDLLIGSTTFNSTGLTKASGDLYLIRSTTTKFLIGNALTGNGSYACLGATSVLFPVQKTTAAAPAYIEGGLYYDTTLHKLMIGGVAGWETVTSG